MMNNVGSNIVTGVVAFLGLKQMNIHNYTWVSCGIFLIGLLSICVVVGFCYDFTQEKIKPYLKKLWHGIG